MKPGRWDDPTGAPSAESGQAGGRLWLLVLACALVLTFALLFVLGYRRVMTTLAARETAPPTASAPIPQSSAAPPAAAAPEAAAAPIRRGALQPHYDPEDLRKSPEAAAREFLAAAQQGDGRTLVKYALRAKLAEYESEADALRDLRALAFDTARVVRSKSTAEKAVLIAAASTKDMTDDTGRPSSIDVVLQLQREDGRWKLFRQQWLIATPLPEYEREALAWLAQMPTTESGGDGPVRKIGSKSR